MSNPSPEETRKTQAAASLSESEEGIPGKYEIDIFEAWCKKCGICIAFCPQKCLAGDEEDAPVITSPELCTGCGWCEIHCPDFAISVREQKARQPKDDDEE